MPITLCRLFSPIAISASFKLGRCSVKDATGAVLVVGVIVCSKTAAKLCGVMYSVICSCLLFDCEAFPVLLRYRFDIVSRLLHGLISNLTSETCGER